MDDKCPEKLQSLFTTLSGLNTCPPIFPLPDDGRRGLIGYTENLTIPALYAAYLQGVFPWFDEAGGEPVLWWSPNPRFVLFPEELHMPKRLARFLKHTPFNYTMDKAFDKVIENCAKIKRKGQDSTWIGEKIIAAYSQLHKDGNARSVEAWLDGNLAGGFYGVQIGRIFFGESMFTSVPNSATSAFMLFVKAFKNAGGKLIDSQVYTENIARFGGKNISRSAFLRYEQEYLFEPLDKDLKAEFENLAVNQVRISQP